MLFPTFIALLLSNSAPPAPEAAPEFLVVARPDRSPLTGEQLIRFTVMWRTTPPQEPSTSLAGPHAVTPNRSTLVVQALQGTTVACSLSFNLDLVSSPALIPYRGNQYWGVRSALIPAREPGKLATGSYQLQAKRGSQLSAPSKAFTVGPATEP